MEEITPQEMLSIINNYSETCNDPVMLGKIYNILLPSCPDICSIGIEFASRAGTTDLLNPEKIKEVKNINQKIIAVIAAKKDQTIVTVVEVSKFIDGTEGIFSTSEIYTAMCAKSKQEKDLIRYALHKFVREKKIMSEGKKSGVYRKIAQLYSVLDIEGADTSPLDWYGPLGLHAMARIYPKSVIVVAGVANMGKSAFAYEMVRANKRLFPIGKARFQTTEAGSVEIKSRLMKYPQDQWPLQWWVDNIEFIDQSENWVDVIDPDGLNVVDYVSDYKEAYMVPFYIKQIHDKLKNGIAVLVVQKDPGKAHGQGGQGVRHAARLAVDIEFQKMTIAKAKVPIRKPPEYKHVDGMFRKFDIEHSWKFVPDGEWQTTDDVKYAGFEDDKPKQKKTPLKIIKSERQPGEDEEDRYI